MSDPRAVRKGEHVMSTMMGNMRRATLTGLIVGALVSLGAGSAVRADVASDKPGAILIWPKIVVDTNAELVGANVDTEIQVTNTSNSVIAARCFIVDATSHCTNAPSQACFENSECPPGGICKPQWSDIDFRMTLTKRQPITWKASEGLPSFPCSGVTGDHCPGGQSNRGSDGTPSFVPPVQEDPFFGEMKCVQVDANDFRPGRGTDPANDFGGDLKGEGTLVAVDPGNVESQLQTTALVDVEKYNAIGIQATAAAANDRDDVLRIGGPNPEYNSCPNVLIMNHFFDDAYVETHAGGIKSPLVSYLTVIPCSEDFLLQENNLGGAVLQFLVYNEFEQRFSTSTSFQCWREVQLSDIDTRPGEFGNYQSIFNVGVQGTLTGQSRIRSVEGPNRANGVLGILEEFWECDPSAHPGGTCTDASNLHFAGERTDKEDQLILSPDLP
jgi:hypothetical protein